MTGTTKKFRYVVCCIIALSFILFLFVSCGILLCNWSDCRWILNDRWQLDPPVPAESELLFYESDQGFHGDGTVQYIFSFPSKPTEFLHDFSAGRDEKTETCMSCAWMDENGKEDHSPDWREEYLWRFCAQKPYMIDGAVKYYTEELYMAYFPASGLLYVFEDLS